METDPRSDWFTTFCYDAHPRGSTVITDSANSATYTYYVENGKVVRLPPPAMPDTDAATRPPPDPLPEVAADTEKTTSGEDGEQDIVAWFQAWDRLHCEIAEGRSSTQP